MKLRHINHDKLKLLIFFCGFYTDENCFLEFDTGKSDIVFVYDYSNLDFSIFDDFDFTPYTEINLMAYSYGVFAANIAAPFLPFLNNCLAICGTIFPIDENYGIKSKIYDLMLGGFNKNVLENFINKMQTGSSGKIKAANRTIENLHNELFNIKNYLIKNKIEPRLNFNKAIIAKNDRIIPYNAQKNYWTGRARILEVECGHFPFFCFKNLDEILEA